MEWIIGALLALFVVLLSYRFRLLTVWGSVAAFFSGWLIFVLGKVPFSVPLLVFFATSNLLSKIGHTENEKKSLVSNQSGQRNARQVLANGLIPAVLLIFWTFETNPIFAILYLCALAAAASDTWATEIGMRFSDSPRSILSAQKVQVGASGGVSAAGFFGALSGAALIALTGVLLFDRSGILNSGVGTFAVITAAGMSAQALDSLMGATIQGKFRCGTCGSHSEKPVVCCEAKVQKESGWRWIDNDAVNFMTGIGAAILGFLFAGIIL